MSINSLSPSIRDEILKRNLILPDAVEENSLGGYAAGVGKPTSISDQSPSVKQQESDTKTFREKIMGLNPYGSNEEQEINIHLKNSENIGNKSNTSSQGTYQGPSEEGTNVTTLGEDERNRMTTMNPYRPINDYYEVDITTKNIEDLGNLSDEDKPKQYNGPGIDVRNTIASRTLNPNVREDDTMIGQLGDDYRNFNLLENIGQNVENETTGRINTNPWRLLTGNDLIRPNFSITVPQGQFGKTMDLGARIMGFEVPVSVMSDSASIFQSENPVDNITRSNEMLDNSGEGQVVTLINTINQNKYRPGFNDDRVRQGLIQAEKGTNHNIYALGTDDGKIKDVLSEETSSPISYSNYQDFNDDFDDIQNDLQPWMSSRDSGFVWVDENNNKEGKAANPGLTEKGRTFPLFGSSNTVPLFSNPDSILYKTNEIFETGRMKTLTAGKGHPADRSEGLQTPVGSGNENLISKGSGVKSRQAMMMEMAGASPSEPSQVFCRAWNPFDKYDEVVDLQKNSGLMSVGEGIERGDNIDESVLDENGFARIGPRKDEEIDVKQYMLSIENLAWSEYTNNLPLYEIGPGDPLTGTKGRIMWFPPYDVSVDDNVSVDWDTTKFIGRGEPIYTYNNTERILTLGFKVIIDYPSYLEYIKGNASDDQLASIASGCLNIDDVPEQMLSVEERENKKREKKKVKEQETEDDNEPDTEEFEFSVHFPNACSDILDVFDFYEDGDDDNISTIRDCDSFTREHRNYPNDDGMNSEWFDIDNNKRQELIDFLSDGGECENCKVRVAGYATSHGNNFRDGEGRTINTDLATSRRDSVITWFENEIGIESERIVAGETEIVDVGSDDANPDDTEVYSTQAKEARKVEVTYIYEPSSNDNNNAKPKNESEEDQEVSKTTISSDIANRLLSERQYFERMKENDSFIYETLGEKLKHFHPSFHSTTPEGFNARLNFLHQCTRQGNTDSFGGGKRPNNLAFGRPPVCILRVGDFFNTKVIIDNLNISFDPLQWDLNPEGVGVQPMIATVHLSMKAIGGSSLKGPINILQNAISYNFFANTEVYEPKAMRVKDDEYNREQDIEINKETKNRRSANEEDGKGENRGENEGDEEARNNESENEGTEEEQSGGLSEFLNDALVQYDQNTTTLQIRFGKSNRTYELDSTAQVKIYSRPSSGEDYKHITTEVVDQNTVNGVVNRSINVDLLSTHGIGESSGVETFDHIIKLDGGSGAKTKKPISFVSN